MAAPCTKRQLRNFHGLTMKVKEQPFQTQENSYFNVRMNVSRVQLAVILACF